MTLVEFKSHVLRHPLLPNELRALRSVQHGHRIEERERDALHRGGYIEVGLGGPHLTEAGRARLALELHRG